MQTKLTLRMDDAVIHRAKRWARARQLSLSGVVADFLASLPEKENAPELSPWTVRLAGAARRAGLPATGEELSMEYLDRMEEKYR